MTGKGDLKTPPAAKVSISDDDGMQSERVTEAA